MIDDPVLLGQWHPVAQSDAVGPHNPVAACVLGTEVVLWRQGAQVMAFEDLCVHRGARLSLGRVGSLGLECAYHGWTYDTTGACVRIPSRPGLAPPSKACVRTFTATESCGLVWVCLGTPAGPVAPYAEWDDPAYRHVLGGPYRIRAAAPRVIENFLDVSHLGFVHDGILGDREHAEVGDHHVRTTPDGLEASDIQTFAPDPDGSGQPGIVTWKYRVLRPLVAYIAVSDPQPEDTPHPATPGRRYTMYFAVAPVDETTSVGWMWNSMNYNHDMTDEDFGAYIDKIVNQDIPIVESQRPELLPLDMAAEMHVRADRVGVAYRRWLAELGVTFGVC